MCVSVQSQVLSVPVTHGKKRDAPQVSLVQPESQSSVVQQVVSLSSTNQPLGLPPVDCEGGARRFLAGLPAGHRLFSMNKTKMFSLRAQVERVVRKII